MHCAVCDSENEPGAKECATCGKVLSAPKSAGPPPEPLQGMEQTMLAGHDLPVDDEQLADVQRTALEADGAPSAWTAGPIEIEPSRELDLDPRTPAPRDDGTCPWCGSPSSEGVCASCGRRRARYLGAPSPAQSAGEIVTCPACYARVSPAARCSQCGLPFPLQEL